MEFERLSRRELQALCKRNKIPANITNVAMVDALKALSFVEGIGEFMQPYQSETAQSSIDSPEGKEVTSPRLPPTGGRTTRRRNVANEEPGTLQPTTRTRRSTRKTLAEGPDEAMVDTTETPSVIQATRRAPIASVCRKMESQLQECEEEEKKNASVTPAPAGITSRRRRGVKEESAVKREYSTRRSVRIAAKKVEVPDDMEKEKSTLFKSEDFSNDSEDVKMNFEESLNNVDETSGITGTDANTTVEQNPDETDESEVVSAIKQHIPIGEHNLEGKDEAGDVPAKQATFEEERGQKSEVDDLKLDGEMVLLKSTAVDVMEVKDELDVVSVEESKSTAEEEAGDVPAKQATFEEERGQKSEVDGLKLDGEMVLLKSTTAVDVMEVKDELDVVSVEESKSTAEEEMGHCFEADVLKCEMNEVKDQDEEEVCFDFEIEAEVDYYAINEVQQSKGSLDACTSETATPADITEHMYSSKEAGFEDDACDTVENFVLQTEDKIAVDISANTEIEKDICGSHDVDSEDVDFNMSEQILEINADVHQDVSKKEMNLDESSKAKIEAAAIWCSNEQGNDVIDQVTDDPNIDMPSEIRTPYKASATKVTPTMKRMTILSDNKENIGSGSIVALTEERVKIAKNTVENVKKVEDMSLRKLTKMLKEQLQITNKLPKNEIANEARGRPALQALPENRLVDRTQN